MNLPKISVITPSYNQGSFIEKTILSVLKQNYENIEYIIIDGGSNDNSVEIIKRYENHLAFWVSESDSGQSNALNKGLSKVTGDIICWINSDDWYEENIFHTVAECFTKQSLDLLVGDCTVVFHDNDNKNFVSKPQNVSFGSMLQYWKINFCPPQPSIFFSKKLLNKVGFLNESLKYSMDLDLWLRMAREAKFYYIEKNLSYYLFHKNSKGGSNTGFEKFELEWQSVCNRHLKVASFTQKLSFYRNLLINKFFSRHS